MTRSHRILLALIVTALIAGCASMPRANGPLYQSAAYYDFLQPDFSSYVSVSKDWLREHRSFISEDIEKELAMNAPFMLTPAQPSGKAALLVHGLGDSPYYFSDIATSLQDQGFHVFVLLLPGHGSKPADLMLPSYQDWQTIVDHYSRQLKNDFEEVWLGGFSTGGNLVTIHAIEEGQIDGLLLFSPGFETHVPFIERLAPLVATFMDWGWRVKEDNLARYRSSPINASIAYTDSAIEVRCLFEDAKVQIPTFIVMSEADSVIDPYAIKHYFETNFVHPDNQLLWYGESLQHEDKLIVKSMKLPELKISTGSHMSPLFAPENPYYGQEGEKRMCGNSFDPEDTARCEKGESVWYSAWGYEEKGKLFARLTWNPYFREMENQLNRFVSVDWQ